MMRLARNGLRWALLAMTACATVAVVVVFNPFAALFDGDAETAVERGRAELTIGSLSRAVESDGELRFTQTRVLASTRVGTLTSVAELGEPAAASTVLFEVDASPTVALIGDVPAWRTMAVDDVGDDVAQLEANLVALGYDPDGTLTVDDTYTDFTADLVELWQARMGFEATGVVTFGQVAFVPDGSSITSISTSSGQVVQGGDASGQATVLTVSSNVRELTFTVQAEDLDTIEIGTPVEARLPDRSTISAAVSGLGAVGDGSWLATATLDPAIDAAALPAGEAIPTTVTWDEVMATDVTTVRANALTRLDSGIYALEVIDADGSTDFVEVGVGSRSGSTVELITDLVPGTAVIAP